MSELPYASQFCIAIPTIQAGMSVQKLVIVYVRMPCMPNLPVVFTASTFSRRSSWVKTNGVTYKPKNIVVLGTSMSMPVFGEIISILITEVTRCHFVCELFTTDSFNPHFHAYEVRRHGLPIPIVICSQQDFVDHHVLALYHVSNLELIPLKYHLTSVEID